MRAALATRRDAVLVSLDGCSAYDSMSRAAFLGKLHEVAPELLPFVRMFDGSPSTYCWWDANGCCRDIEQGEGCEQGDALAPALFALGQHDALHQAAAALHPEDSLVAFLDDLYVITTPPRARSPPFWAKPESLGSKLVRPRPGLLSWARMCGEATSPQHSAESLSLARPRAPGVRAGMGRGKAAYGAAAPRPVAQAAGSAMRMAATAALRIPKGQPCHSDDASFPVRGLRKRT